MIYHPCFATRLAGVSGGKDTQGWRDSSHTAMVGAGKFGSAKLPMAPNRESAHPRHLCDSAWLDGYRQSSCTPGDGRLLLLPVEQPAKVELLVNLQTAKTLGVEVPLPLLIRADELLE